MTPFGFWINYLPEAIHDFEIGNTVTNHRLSIGKEFSGRFGLSFDFAKVDRNRFHAAADSRVDLDLLLSPKRTHQGHGLRRDGVPWVRTCESGRACNSAVERVGREAFMGL